MQWLTRKAAGSGFRLHRVCIQPEGVIHGLRRHGRECNRLRLYSTFYKGILEVEDPVLFAGVIRSGIGSGKAFGFGLLSVAALSLRDMADGRLQQQPGKAIAL